MGAEARALCLRHASATKACRQALSLATITCLLPLLRSWMLFDMLSNRNEWWVPGKIADVRARLAGAWREPGGSRDVLLLDLALDSYFRTCIERADRGGMGRDALFEMGALVLRNAAYGCESDDLHQVCAQYTYGALGACLGRLLHCGRAAGALLCVVCVASRMFVAMACFPSIGRTHSCRPLPPSPLPPPSGLQPVAAPGGAGGPLVSQLVARSPGGPAACGG